MPNSEDGDRRNAGVVIELALNGVSRLPTPLSGWHRRFVNKKLNKLKAPYRPTRAAYPSSSGWGAVREPRHT